MADFDPKKFIAGFNLLNGAVRGKLYYHVLIIAIVLTGACYILNKATTKTDSTVITVQPGGVANVSTVKEVKKQNWSVGMYLQTRTNDFKDVTVGGKIDYHF